MIIVINVMERNVLLLISMWQPERFLSPSIQETRTEADFEKHNKNPRRKRTGYLEEIARKPSIFIAIALCCAASRRE